MAPPRLVHTRTPQGFFAGGIRKGDGSPAWFTGPWRTAAEATRQARRILALPAWAWLRAGLASE